MRRVGRAMVLSAWLAPLLLAGSGSAAAPAASPVLAAELLPGPSGGADSARPCQEASTTLEMQACLQAEVVRLERQLGSYLEAAQRREARLAAEEDRPQANLAATQRLWRLYRDAHCQDLYRHWSGGSIRGVMALSCRQVLSRERLRRIWADYLTFPDGSPPLLPDPEPPPGPQANPRR